MVRINTNKTIFIIIILINILCYFQFYRFDLTTDNRHSLSKETKNILNNLDDIIHVKIFLHGSIPTQYKKLTKELNYILDEFKVHSKFITYDFIDPSESDNKELRNGLYEELYKKGIQPIPHRNYSGNKSEETWIFPGITLTHKTKEISKTLIDNAVINNTDITIKKSIENLEHLLITSIREITTGRKKKIGLITGHGETTDQRINSFKKDVSTHYELEEVHINEQLTTVYITE